MFNKEDINREKVPKNLTYKTSQRFKIIILSNSEHRI